MRSGSSPSSRAIPGRPGALLEESLSLFRALGDGWGVANTLGHIGNRGQEEW